MAYSRPMYRRRAPARKYQSRPSRGIYKKTVKKGAIRTLDRKVKTIVRKMAGLKSTVQYKQSGAAPIGNVAGTGYYVIELSRCGTAAAQWTRIFGTDADDESNHQALWRKTNLDLEIDAGTERNNLDYTIYVVSLTKKGQGALWTQATGSLAGPLGASGLVNDVHYAIGGTYGQAFLNRNYFNVLASRRFMTGSGGALAYETASLRKRFYFKMAHNNGKGFLVKQPSGDWRTQQSPQVAGQNLYVLIFNNDSTADATVNVKYNAIHTVDIN